MTPTDPRRVHHWDTLIALSRDLAAPMAVFYRECRAHGMDAEAARVVTVALLTLFVAPIPPTQEQP
jgi:hypothetical protein